MNTLSVRLADSENPDDVARLVDIVESEAAASAMDEISGMDEEDIEEWIEDSLDAIGAKNDTDWEILYAVTPINDKEAPHRNNKLEGFVNFYASGEVTDRFRREMTQLKKSFSEAQSVIEVSMAKWPGAPRGQMTLGLCLACVEINERMKRQEKNNMIIAYIDPENVPSQKAFEKAGFEKQGLVYYDLDDDNESLEIDGVLLYTIEWPKLHAKLLEGN